MCVLKKNQIIIPKYKVIKLNIYIFNAFVVKILIKNLTFGDKVHKSKNVYYNIEWQGINVRNKHYMLYHNTLKIDLNYMNTFGMNFEYFRHV